MRQVLIAGGGPTGMMLAAELALGGADVAVVEKRSGPEFGAARSAGLLSRTIEVLDQRGIAGRFLSEGKVVEEWGELAGVTMGIANFPTRHPYVLGLWQNHFERILSGWVDELPVTRLYDSEITGFEQDGEGVSVSLAGGDTLRCEYLVGCDGGRSLVRKTAGIEFAGWDATSSNLVAEVFMDGEPEFGFQRDEKGVHAMGPLEDGRVRLVIREEELEEADEPTLEDLRRLLVSVRGTDYGLSGATSISRFTDMSRQAAAYREGRVLLAGDAAHVHSPMGGQGMGTGLQDAVNLGWKLAQVVRGTSPESLLDSYHAERHPVGARVLETTMALGALSLQDARTRAVGGVVAELLEAEDARKRFAARLAGLDLRYDLGDGHPLLGRRMPDLDLDGGGLSVYSLLHAARPVLLDFAGGSSAGPRVQHVAADYTGGWELPVLGEVPAPSAVLIRPDGYVAWVGDGTDAGLAEAAERWF